LVARAVSHEIATQPTQVVDSEPHLPGRPDADDGDQPVRSHAATDLVAVSDFVLDNKDGGIGHIPSLDSSVDVSERRDGASMQREDSELPGLVAEDSLPLQHRRQKQDDSLETAGSAFAPVTEGIEDEVREVGGAGRDAQNETQRDEGGEGGASDAQHETIRIEDTQAGYKQKFSGSVMTMLGLADSSRSTPASTAAHMGDTPASGELTRTTSGAARWKNVAGRRGSIGTMFSPFFGRVNSQGNLVDDTSAAPKQVHTRNTQNTKHKPCLCSCPWVALFVFPSSLCLNKIGYPIPGVYQPKPGGLGQIPGVHRIFFFRYRGCIGFFPQIPGFIGFFPRYRGLSDFFQDTGVYRK